jgi:hypothetical protein
LQNWFLNKGNNTYLPNIIEPLITNPDNGVFGFYLELDKSKGSTKQGGGGLTFSILLFFEKAKSLWYLG